MDMTHEQIITALGGYRAVALELKRHPSRVFHWIKEGIPSGLWLAVVKMADRKGVFLSVEGVARSAPRNSTKP